MMSFKEYLPFLIEGVVGTYAGVRFDQNTIRDLVILQDLLGIPNRVSPDKFHSTLLYSRVPLPNYTPFGVFPIQPTSDTNVFELKIFKTSSGKNALVLVYNSTFLSDRHSSLMSEHGATWDFPSYIPHITLSYDIGDFPVKLDAISFLSDRKIVISEEYSEPIDPEWG